MALGKNLKKKKLIETETEKPVSKKIKKKTAPKKKNLIAKEKHESAIKKVGAKKKYEASKDKDSQGGFNPALSMFIANKLREKKSELRAKYSKQIEELKEQTIQFISFQIGGELYAIDIDQVKEIVQIPRLSKTPNTASHIRGVANVRKVNYVAFDLAKRFHVEEDNEANFLLILNNKELKASLTLPFLPSTFKASGKNISTDMNMIEDSSLDISYIKGIIQYQDQLIYYLDIIEMLSNDKAIVVPDEMISE